ncbi:unnamed protein product [Closterium sp. Yama58-4]|nr:unnamed protein product [Closterium sp. Yama58-4]
MSTLLPFDAISVAAASKLDPSPLSSPVSSIATSVAANRNHHRLPELRSGVAFAHPSPQLKRLVFSHASPHRISRQFLIVATTSSSSFPTSSQLPAFPGMSAADSQSPATVPERAIRFTVTNGDGSKLSAFLVEPNADLPDPTLPDGAMRESANGGDRSVADGSAKVVIICHGFRSTKLSSTVQKLSDAILAAGFATVRFDFSGNGESEGAFATGNYRHEAADLHSVVEWVRAQGRHVEAVVGHSKGGNCVLLYASLYKDVPKVINVSGRYDLSRGIKERFGEEGMAKLEEEGQLTQQDKYGSYIVTKESIQERLATDMAAAARAIPPSCSVCTIHGSEDATVPVEDASSFHTDVPNHHLHIIDGACHNFRIHGQELVAGGTITSASLSAVRATTLRIRKMVLSGKAPPRTLRGNSKNVHRPSTPLDIICQTVRASRLMVGTMKVPLKVLSRSVTVLAFSLLAAISAVGASTGGLDAVPVRIDCGSAQPSVANGVEWQADAFFDGGEAVQLPAGNESRLASPIESSLRAFPPSTSQSGQGGGCYNVPLTTGARYLVRVGVAYRNYDGASSPPFFDIRINGLLVKTLTLPAVEPQFPSSAFYSDFLVYALQGSISVCFTPFLGAPSSTPLVNSLEFLPIRPETYDAASIGTDAILTTLLRINFGGPEVTDAEDVGYRTWARDVNPGVPGGGPTRGLQPLQFATLSTTQSISNAGSPPDELPAQIFQSARVGKDAGVGRATGFIYRMDPQNPLHLFYVRLHFAEIEEGVKQGDRRFDIKLSQDSIFGHEGEHMDEDTVDQQGKLWPNGFDIIEAANGSAFKGVTLPIFFNYSVYAENYGRELRVWLPAMPDSPKPPLLSAVELYEITRTPVDGYVYRGMTGSDIAGIVMACVFGVIFVLLLAWLLAARFTRSSRQYAIFGASGKHNRGSNI